jgi:hypothetical protein
MYEPMMAAPMRGPVGLPVQTRSKWDNVLRSVALVLVLVALALSVTAVVKQSVAGPRGATGQQGTQGPQGPTGPQGDIGPQGPSGDGL